MKKKEREKFRDARFLEFDRLAAAGEFDTLTNEINLDNVRVIDKEYKFIPKSYIFKTFRFIMQVFLWIIGRPIMFFAHFGKIEGRENVKKLGRKQGAVSVSNHVFYLDNLFVRSAMRPHRAYYTAATHNMKKGFRGQALRAAGVLPIPEGLAALKNLNAAIEEVVKMGNIVHVYPEQSMWNYYDKPRPLKKGAFYFAAKLGVPVLPCFMLFREPGRIFKRFHVYKPATFRIFEPIWPKPELSVRENEEYFLSETENVFRRAYCDFYGKSV